MVITKPLSKVFLCHKVPINSLKLCNFGASKFNIWFLPLCSLNRYFTATETVNTGDGKCNGPVSELSKKISNGELSPDEHQSRIAEDLQRVYDEIQNYSPPNDSLFSKLFTKKVKKKSPKGLYIYGSVGGGKTMLMDLFHNCMEVRTNLYYATRY